ncbi:transmembrane protein 186 [Coturnix japonica]|uniref:Transmembrane protein 186 n=1 Tax=Coturnix japonica TaxID=93934 RepID=A0A8C2U1S1_COTJA|nr:transmembrane protein 186 [Coturnix japonica]
MAMVRLCCVRSGRALSAMGRWLHGGTCRTVWKEEAAGPPCSLGRAVCWWAHNGRIHGFLGDRVPSRFLRRWSHRITQNHTLTRVGRDLKDHVVPTPLPGRAAPVAAIPQVGGGKSEEFRVVYRFPGIKYCRLLSRLKLLQTATTLLVLPPVCYLHLQQQLPQAVLLYTAGIAVFAAVMLYGMSYFFRRIIGLIYLSESGRTVKVSHMTFWGRRNDICCPLETVMTLDEVGDARGELLLRFRRYNSTEVLYFTIKYGQIVDRQKFMQIFGELQ